MPADWYSTPYKLTFHVQMHVNSQILQKQRENAVSYKFEDVLKYLLTGSTPYKLTFHDQIHVNTQTEIR